LTGWSRRSFLEFGAGVCFCSVCGPARATVGPDLPSEVAGVRLPRSELARKAAAFAAKSCPPFLLNHCMRTFVFGGLALRKLKLTCDAEQAFVAAALHDLGLLPAFASPQLSFEIDGANAAEKFVRGLGVPPAAADIVWHAVEMHDGKWPLTKRQGPEAMLVSLGAGIDVDGPDPTVTDQHQLQEVLKAFPRLEFKRRFTALLIDHCKRKPTSQRGTWLEGLCREQVPQAWTETVEGEIARSAFVE
jgi:hypothetical protein